MSFPLQPFYPQDRPVAMQNQIQNQNQNPIESLFGLAHQIISQFLQNEIDPNAQVFGFSAMKVMQITPGANGQPQVVQAHEERRFAPGGFWQTTRALRDPQRGINRMQMGVFQGNQGEIVDRQFDPIGRQYREEIHRRSNMPTNFNPMWSRPNPYQIQYQQASTPALPAPPLPSTFRPQ